MELDQQHYIPRNYIERFSQNKKIEVYDRELRKFLITNPKNIAKEKGYNCVKSKVVKEKCLNEYSLLYPEEKGRYKEVI